MSDTILGADGQPHMAATPQPSQPGQEGESITASQFCAGVLSAYIDQMAQNGIDPVNALLEMGTQVPSAMIQFIRFHTNGLTQPAEEPLKILLQEISKISNKFGFRMMFQLSHAGEPQGEEDGTDEPNTGSEPDTAGEVQGCCDEENEGCAQGPGSTCDDG